MAMDFKAKVKVRTISVAIGACNNNNNARTEYVRQLHALATFAAAIRRQETTTKLRTTAIDFRTNAKIGKRSLRNRSNAPTTYAQWSHVLTTVAVGRRRPTITDFKAQVLDRNAAPRTATAQLRLVRMARAQEKML